LWVETRKIVSSLEGPKYKSHKGKVKKRPRKGDCGRKARSFDKTLAVAWFTRKKDESP